MIKKLLVISFCFSIASCAPTISNFNLYKPKPLPKTTFMPTKEVVDGKPYKVVVFKLNEGDNQIAKESDLGSTITVKIENILTKNRVAQLVDRQVAGKLEKEIALAEMNKTVSYKGPQIADYAMSGSIGNASFTKKFSSARNYIDANGHMVRVPAQFTYSSDVSGNIKIYELPSMQVVENFEFSGNKSRAENVQTDGGATIMGIADFGGTHAKGADRDDNLVRKAGENAVNSIGVDIKNFFARQGFILEKRSLEDKSIFKINLGSADGIAQGDEFEVSGKFAVDNSLTGVTETEKRIIASGKVADKIDPKSCWVIINDKKDIDGIRLGDMVKLKYKKSFFSNYVKFSEE